MKRVSFLLLGALALFINACEMHKASELEGESHHGDAKAQHAESTPAAHPEKAKTEEAKPGEAPKFFPEKK